MSYRDDEQGLRARVETLEEELARAQSTIARLRGEGAAKSLVSDKPAFLLGAPSHLEIERELPFEVTDEGYEAIAELIRRRLPTRGDVAQVGRTLTCSFRGHELVRVTRVAPGKTLVRIHADHRGHGALTVALTALASLFGLGAFTGLAKSFGWSPAALLVALPLLVVATFTLLRGRVASAVHKDRQHLAGVLEAIDELAAQHAAPARARIAGDAHVEDQAVEEAAEEEVAEKLAER